MSKHNQLPARQSTTKIYEFVGEKNGFTQNNSYKKSVYIADR